MPYITSKNREEFLAITVPGSLYDRKTSNWFDRTYIPDGNQGYANERYVRPGMVVAIDTDTNKFVPYSAGASYGTGSDTAVGVLDTFEILTLGDSAIAPLYHGKVIESHAYVFGTTLGTISAGVKTDLPDIEWV